MTRYSPDSRTPPVLVLNYYLLVISILAVLIRLGTKLWKLRAIFRDDYYIIVSLVCVLESIAAV